MENIAYFLSLFIAIITSLSISVLSWRRKPSSGAIPLSILMLSVAEWLMAQALQDLSSDTAIKLIWFRLKFIGVVTVPVVWLVLTLQYAKFEAFITKYKLIGLSIIPCITTFAVWTDSYFGLFFKDIYFIQKGYVQIAAQTEGNWFWVHTYYSYILILSGIFVLFSSLFKLPKIYRKQVYILLSGAFIPLIGNIFTVFYLIKLPYTDITPIALLFTGILFFWALFKYRLLDIIPIARHTVIENIKDLIMVLDNQNRIVDINPAAETFLGLKASNIVGTDTTYVLSRWPELIEKYKDSLEASEKIAVKKDNTEICYNLNITPIYDSKRNILGRLFTFRDITALENTMKDLEASRKAAEAANTAKSHFLANMSHEIRTPMNAIIGMADLLEGTTLTSEQKEYVTLVKTSASSLLEIISDILDFSKIEAGKLQIDNTVFNLKGLIEETGKVFSVLAARKSIKFDYFWDKSIPVYVQGDALRLRQILVNLINNAIKFTPKGHVHLKVSCTSIENNIAKVLFSVSDTGIGIPESKIDKLFERFHQLDGSSTRKYGGTGLGLTIVKNLLEIMGGTINVKSEENKGSVFSFELQFPVSEPLSSTERESASAAVTSSPGNHTEDIKILIVEDNIINQVLISKLISKRGWSSDLADNGKTAVDKYEKRSYDLILMDMQMPDMDGFEATAAIRQKEHFTRFHIPIIALTANAMPGDREKCIEAGMDDYLSKPIKSDVLYKMIEKHTKREGI